MCHRALFATCLCASKHCYAVNVTSEGSQDFKPVERKGEKFGGNRLALVSDGKGVTDAEYAENTLNSTSLGSSHVCLRSLIGRLISDWTTDLMT